MEELTGKVAIVTGGARGMGEATSRLFVEAGARVVIADILDGEGTELARQLGANAAYRHHDVTDESSWASLVAGTVAEWGQIDILINNAGVLLFKTLVDTSKAEFEKVLSVNLTGGFLGIRAVAPHMIGRGKGAIVNISSVDGIHGANGLGAYCSSKWGVRGLTRVAALELGHKGIRVNSVHPGGVDTFMSNPDKQPRSAIDKHYPDVPLQRIGAPEEIARVSLFLASDAASYVCGAEVPVDGGMVVGHYYRTLPGAPGV